MNKKIVWFFLFCSFGDIGFIWASTPCNPVFNFVGLSQDGGRLYWEQEVGGECVPTRSLFQYDFSKNEAEPLYFTHLEGYAPDPRDPKDIPLVEYKRRKKELEKTLQKQIGQGKLSLQLNRHGKKNAEMIQLTGNKRCILPDPIYKEWEKYLVFPPKRIKTAQYIDSQQIWWVVTRHCNLANASFPEKTCPEDEGLALYSSKGCQ